MTIPAVRGAEFAPPYADDCQFDAAAWVRVNLCYMWRHGRTPRLTRPQRFTEFVQHRKLLPPAPKHTAMLDKVASKEAVGVRLGAEWVVPTLWSGPALGHEPQFQCPAIVKARHGCNQNAVLPAAPSQREWASLRRRSRRWTAKPYGVWLDERAYFDVPRGIIAEPLLGDGVTPPIDYKIYVFGGQATHIQVHLGRGTSHRWMLHDRQWRRLVAGTDNPAAPRSLGAMLDAAETLAAGQDFVRVDFYEIDGQPLFGEFCLYPGSGLDPFEADWIDYDLGTLWRNARTAAV